MVAVVTKITLLLVAVEAVDMHTREAFRTLKQLPSMLILVLAAQEKRMGMVVKIVGLKLMVPLFVRQEAVEELETDLTQEALVVSRLQEMVDIQVVEEVMHGLEVL